MKIVLVYSPAPREVREWALVLPPGSTAACALERSGIFLAFPELATSRPLLGVWSRKTGLKQVLQEDDRLEIYRPLRVDPKVARRERFTSQGVNKTGLFARKRAGAKAGY
jgi:putative ubiquitin-RnfH superfamily antitoxin RatB of RatAB toxin-antitoxin module